MFINQIDPSYEPKPIERKTLFGLTLEQKRNDAVIDSAVFSNIVSDNRRMPETAVRDLIVATIALKYTQRYKNKFYFSKNIYFF